MTTTLLPLPSLVRASAFDAANRSMSAAGRTKWNDDDWNAMVETQDRLLAAGYGEGPEGCFRFQIAEQLQKAGVLTIGMSAKDFLAALDAIAATPSDLDDTLNDIAAENETARDDEWGEAGE